MKTTAKRLIVRRWRVLALAVVGALALALAGTAVANHATIAGEPELFNLEHVYNFNPGGHEDRGGAGSTVGSDLEMFSHEVPLRDYATGDLVDGTGAPLPDGADPVFGERDFVVMGSYDRGGYVFDITDPAAPEFVTVVRCRQPRNDVGIKKFTDPVSGQTRVVLALTQQSGVPCGDADSGGVGVQVNTGPNSGDFYGATQWTGTAAVDNQTAELVYAGTGCSNANYAGLDVAGKIAIVDKRFNPDDPGGPDQCPTFTFFQKMRAAETAGAIGLIQVDEDDNASAGSAVSSGIPGMEISNTEGSPIRDQVVAGQSIEVTLRTGPSTVPIFGTGSGGIGVFDITDPYNWAPMYRVLTFADGAHNFAFHPTKPFGNVSPGELPGVISDMPIIDFTDLDAPVLVAGPESFGGIHDLEFSPDGDRIYAASENHYIIYDNTDPLNPFEVSATNLQDEFPDPPNVPNVGSYAHGVFADSDLDIMVTNNESLVAGGFLAPGTCPGEGLAVYDISGTFVPGASEAAPAGPIGTYVPAVIGDPAPRFCTSHFGRFAPGTKVMSMAWYVGGVRIIDFSDPFNPTEIATAVMADGGGTSNTWAAKFHEGPYVYAGDMERGFDVFRWTGEGPPPWEDDDDPEPGDGDKVTGGGYLASTDAGKVNFGFNAKAKAGGFQGNLTLNDKPAGAKVKLDTVTFLGDVRGECGSVAVGPDSAQFTGTGTFNGAPAGFRVCVADRGEPGNSGAGGADLFYLECTAGCSYTTGDRTADDVIDGGNIQVHRAGAGPSAAAATGATVLVLDPLLLTHSSAPVEVLTVRAYDGAGEPLSGTAVTLESVDAAGAVTSLDAVTDAAGLATFTVTVTAGEVEHVAHSGGLGSNAVNITGNL